jgi:hypothetical protein
MHVIVLLFYYSCGLASVCRVEWGHRKFTLFSNLLCVEAKLGGSLSKPCKDYKEFLWIGQVSATCQHSISHPSV